MTVKCFTVEGSVESMWSVANVSNSYECEDITLTCPSIKVLNLMLNIVTNSQLRTKSCLIVKKSICVKYGSYENES